GRRSSGAPSSRSTGAVTSRHESPRSSSGFARVRARSRHSPSASASSLSRRLPVHFFIFSPSAEYWSDIRSQREIIREVLASGGELDEAALGLEIGNPLLASLGRVGRD